MIERLVSVVPEIVGPRIPVRYKEDDANLYAKYALLFFQPVRKRDLNIMKQTNYNFRNEFLRMSNSQNFKTNEYHKILDKLQEYYEGKKIGLVTARFNKLREGDFNVDECEDHEDKWNY